MAEPQETQAPQTPETPPAPATPPAEPPAPQDFEAMFDGLLERKMPQIMRQALKDSGVEGDEAKEIIEAYRAGKKTQGETSAQELQALQAKLAALSAEKQQSEVAAEVTRLATELGVEPKRITHLSKLADLSAAVKDDKPDAEAIKAALEKVLEDLPEFKQQTGGIKIGAGTSGAGQGADELSALLAAAGVPPKKE